MLDVLQHLFGCVCGQDPSHTWSPGGLLLPFCQRCTGLYVGAFVSALMHFNWRPRPTNRWLWLNGAFLLVMIPFGFLWLPQGPVLRTTTGLVFGFGLVAFLWLTLGRRGRREFSATCCAETTHRFTDSLVPGLALIAATALILWLCANGGTLAANALILLATLGAIVLFGLVLANLALAMFRVSGWVRRHKPVDPERQTMKN